MFRTLRTRKGLFLCSPLLLAGAAFVCTGVSLLLLYRSTMRQHEVRLTDRIAEEAPAAASVDGDPTQNTSGAETRTVVIGTELDYPPYSYLDENNRPAGFNAELAAAIAQVMGLSVRVEIAPWNRIREGLADGSIDIIAGMYYSEERSRSICFSPHYTVVHHAVFARKGSPPVASEADLHGKSLIVMRGDIMHDYVLQQGITQDIILTDSQAEALRLLSSGKHDYALLAKLPGLYWIGKMGLENVTLTGPAMCPSRYCFAAGKDNGDLIDTFSEGLAILKATGKYKSIYDRWLGVHEPEVKWAYAFLKYFGIIAGVLLGIFLCFVLWSWNLKRQIAAKTIQLQQELDQRQRAEQVLRESEEHYRCLVENIDLGIVLIDQQYRILAINKTDAQFVGKTPHACIGQECFRVFEKREAACPHCPGVRAMQTGRPAEVESTGVRDDGTTFAARIQAFPVRNPDGKPNKFIEVVEDITNRKRTEEELTRAKQAAEAANRSKSELLANMSHEIRTPMTAILGFADLLLENSVTEEAIEAARIIQRNGNHLLQLINDILDLSKIEAGKYEIEQVACSPRDIAAEAVSLMKVRADAKGLPLRLEVADDVPGMIATDPTRLRQILVNLVGNAIKFTEVGSVRVVVQADGPSDTEPALRFDVIDTGIGMTEEQQSLLFQPFFQADASASRRFGGTGLGLAISKRLAGMLGGDILVQSRLGQGSTFSLSIGTGRLDGLAATPEPSKSLPARKLAGKDQPKLNCRILLAEDGPDNQRLIAFLLRKAGAEVEVAENGRIALELALAARQVGSPFDMLLMDMQMPVMDGYEATRELRSAGYKGPIVALTAHAMSGDRQKCLDAGCDDYLTKPIDPKKLIGLLEPWVGTDAEIDLSAGVV